MVAGIELLPAAISYAQTPCKHGLFQSLRAQAAEITKERDGAKTNNFIMANKECEVKRTI